MNCPTCQTENPDQAKFCFNCGTPLALTCTNCGTSLPAGAKFCFNCGQATAVSAPAPTAEAQPPAEQSVDWLHRYIPESLLNKLEAARSSGLMEGERRIVTILFCDVKGSTAAAATMDPEEWSLIMNGAFEPMIAPVYRYEGTVARLTGDGLLAFFGAPIAHEDDPQRAVLAALDIIEAVQAYAAEVKQRWGLDFEIRIGLNTGLVVVGAMGSDLRMEYTALGNAINVAARMEQTAELGTVQIAQPTYKLVAPFFEFEDLGGLQVKGIEEPVQAYRVRGAKSDPGSLRGLAGLHAPLVGRAAQMAALRTAVSTLNGGSGHILSVLGEAGLGKSRLVSELRQALGADPAWNGRWLQGHSQSFETRTPFAPFAQLFRAYFKLDGQDNDAANVARIKVAIDALQPGSGDAVAPFFAALLGLDMETADAERIKYLQPPELRGAIFAQVANLLQAELARGPLVLYLDDLHWVDPTSLELLQALVPLTESLPLAIITAFRPRREEPSWIFHEAMLADRGQDYQALNLDPLDHTQARELVGSLLTIDDLPESVRQTILDKSEGNPFFVEETIRTLLDRGLVVREDGHWRATQEIRSIAFPDTLVGVITARLDRLDENTRHIIQAASVLGREFSAEIVRDIAALPAAVDASIAELLRRELIQHLANGLQPTYMFRHILTQEAAYNSILLSNRRELHRRAAEALQARHPHRVADIARHWLEARFPARALPFLVQAGENAARAYATAEAIDYFRQALELRAEADDPQSVRRAYAGLGGALAFSGQVEQAMAVFQELLAFGEAYQDLQAQITALNKMASTAATMMGQFPMALDLLARAETLNEKANDLHGAAESALIRCQLCTAQADFDGVISHMGELAEIAERTGSKEYMTLGLEHVSSSLMWLTRFEEARETAETALALAREVGDREHEAVLLTMTIPLLSMRKGDLDQAQAEIEEGLALARRINAVFPQIMGEWAAAEIAQKQGDYARALALGNDALARALPLEGMMPWIVVAPLGSLGTTYLHLSSRFKEEIVDFHHHALQLLESPAGTMMGSVAWSDLGYCALALDDIELARETFQQGLNTPNLFMLVERPRLLAGSALVALADGQPDKALALAQEGADMAHENQILDQIPSTFSALGRILAARGEHEAALAALAEAETSADQMGLRPDLWQIRMQAAEILQADGRIAEAHAKRAAARDVIEDIAAGFTDQSLRAAYLEDALARILT